MLHQTAQRTPHVQDSTRCRKTRVLLLQEVLAPWQAQFTQSICYTTAGADHTLHPRCSLVTNHTHTARLELQQHTVLLPVSSTLLHGPTGACNCIIRHWFPAAQRFANCTEHSFHPQRAAQRQPGTQASPTKLLHTAMCVRIPVMQPLLLFCVRHQQLNTAAPSSQLLARLHSLPWMQKPHHPPCTLQQHNRH
jgi:hypothetical protein